MRTVPIISIIRRYGLTSKRLNPRNRIRYEDAIKMIKTYENSSLKIEDVVDNTRKRSHNNCHCGIPGCGQRIRYEYILKFKDKNEDPNKEIIAGSTCVWPTLGMSELQKKDFLKLDATVRDHYALLDWMDKNPDVVSRIEILKKEDVPFFKAFWEEIEVAPLLDEDTEYIRNIDIERELEKNRYKKERSKKEKEDAKRAESMLDDLCKYFKDNYFLERLKSWRETQQKYFSNSSRNIFTDSQLRWIKIYANRKWFEENVKGSKMDFTEDCEDMLHETFAKNNYLGKGDQLGLDDVEVDIKRSDDIYLRYAWISYKVKNDIVRVYY